MFEEDATLTLKTVGYADAVLVGVIYSIVGTFSTNIVSDKTFSPFRASRKV